jgi:hypothetical protein
MHETMRAFCRRYGVHYESEPQLLPHSRKSWLVVDASGGQWVVKPNQPDDKSAEMLRSFNMLHPPFRHPRSLSNPDDLTSSIPTCRVRSWPGGPSTARK